MAASSSVTFTATLSTFTEAYSAALPVFMDCVSVTAGTACAFELSGAVTVTVWGVLHMPVPVGVKVRSRLPDAVPPPEATWTAAELPLETVTVTSALGWEVRTTV